MGRGKKKSMTKEEIEDHLRKENAFLRIKLEAMKRVLESADRQISKHAALYDEKKADQDKPQGERAEPKDKAVPPAVIPVVQAKAAVVDTKPKEDSTPPGKTEEDTAVVKPDENKEENKEDSHSRRMELYPKTIKQPDTAPPRPVDTTPSSEGAAVMTAPADISMAQVDEDSDEENEDDTAVKTRSTAMLKTKLKQIFNHFDVNKAGRLSFNYVVAIGMSAQQWSFTLDPKRREDMIETMQFAFGLTTKIISRSRFVEKALTIDLLRDTANTIDDVTELLRPGDDGGEPLPEEDDIGVQKSFFLKRPLRRASFKSKRAEGVKPSVPVLESDDASPSRPVKSKRRMRHNVSIAFGKRRSPKKQELEENVVFFEAGDPSAGVAPKPPPEKPPELSMRVINPVFDEGDEDDDELGLPQYNKALPNTTTTSFSGASKGRTLELEDADYLLSMISAGVTESTELTDSDGCRYHIDGDGNTAYRESDLKKMRAKKNPPGTPTGVRRFSFSDDKAAEMSPRNNLTHVKMADQGDEDDDTKFGFDDEDLEDDE